MAQLNTLPNETIQQIQASLHPSSIVDFACTCKRIHALSASHLKQHRERIKKYREVTDRYSSTIPDVLQAIQDDVRVAWYIRRLVVFQQRCSWADWPRFDDEADELAKRAQPLPIGEVVDLSGRQYGDEPLLSSSFMDSIRKMQIKNELRMFEHGVEKESVYGDTSSGDDICLKMALLSQATMIDTLIVTAHEAPFEDSIIGTISLASDRGMQNVQEDWLPSLSHVYLNHRTAHQESQAIQLHLITANWAPFLTLPSIQTLSVQVGSENDDQERFKWEVGGPASKLQHLHLSSFPVSKSEIPELVDNITALKSYAIAGDYFDPLMDEEAEDIDITALLLKTHGSTLETLHYSHGDADGAISSMRHFKVLRELRLDAYRLFTDEDLTTIIDLTHFLPPSLQTLKITSSIASYDVRDTSLTPEQADTLASGLATYISHECSEHPHNLKTLCTRNVCTQHEDGITKGPNFQPESLSTACAENNIKWSHSGLSECSICAAPQHIISDGSDWLPDACGVFSCSCRAKIGVEGVCGGGHVGGNRDVDGGLDG